ncbi:MAG: hypothetical protein ACO3AV_02140 [Ilumatobacteraceae bacterium]
MAGLKRPFWMHQLVEYILGGALIASGLQSPTPLVPAVVGGIVVLHAGITKGALAAFQVLHRSVHRVIDPFVIALELVAAFQPWIEVDSGSRAILIGIAVVHVVVFLGSSFEQKVKAPKSERRAGAVSAVLSQPGRTGDTSTDIGRSAGRIAASGVKAFRRLRADD